MLEMCYKRYIINRSSQLMMKHKILITILLVSMQIWISNSQACDPAHNRQLLGGLCVCKPGYYDSGPQNCPACSSPCMTCVTTATTCTGCDSSLYRTLSGTTCICMDGYVNISGVCQPCHYSCKTCSGLLSTNCIACDTSTRLFSANMCPCLNGTYDNTTLQSCQPCNAKCLWCAAQTSNDCTNCDANLLRQMGTSNPGPCLCYDGFYDTTVALCQPCLYSCVTCAITSTTCLTCDLATQQRSLSGTSCSCISHYYDSGTAVCSMCSPRCGNCTTSADTCLTCNTTVRVLTGTTCPCMDGYYQDSATISCLPCTNYCKTCVNSSSTCLSCYNYGNRVLYNATCGCITGYYDNGTIFCQKCPYYCDACVGPDPPTCTSCPSSSHRSLGTGACACDNGYYDDGSSATCSPCLYSCETCSSAPSMCTSCDSTAHRAQVATDCECSIGYYDDGTNQMCAPCHYSCLTCFGGGSNQCYACQPNRDYINYSCPCFTGMYELTQLCYTCDNVCATCITTATYCLSCPISRSLANHTCVCADGYYASGLACPACSIECATCTTSSTTCLSCNPLMGTVLSGSSCICPDKYYKNTTTLACLACHYSCSTCLSSSSMYDCRTCDATLFRTLSGSAPSQCVCNAGYFDAGVAVCGVCHSHCSSCVGASDYNCTGCMGGYVLIGSYCKYNTTCLNYLYDNNCVNTCPNSTYGTTTSSGNMCLPCTNGCLTCTSATYCLSCNATTYYNATSHACMQYCPIGHYIQASGSCTQCPINCIQCIIDTTLRCLECSAGYVKQDGGACVIGCTSGHLLVGTMCHRCPANCLVCSSLSSTGCTTCQSGFHMLAGACHTTCPLGYMPAIANGRSQCMVCPSSCSTCMNNRCLSCTTGYYLDYESTCTPLGYLTSWDGTLIKCHPNCKSCTNTSFSSCIMCAQLRGDTAEMAVSGYCECKSGSVDTGDGNCDLQAYQDVVKATEVLIGATQSTIFLSVIVSIISTNFILVLGLGNYLQSYSMMYFLNSSAVMQTDIVLQHYYNINPIYYYRTQSNSSSALSNPKNARLMVTTQTDQSLFFRGNQWEYLSDWVFLALAVNVVIWGIPILLHVCLCCCCRYKNRISNIDRKITLELNNQENSKNRCNCCTRFISKFFTNCLKYPFGFYIRQFLNKYNESVAIIFFMLTYSEVSLYAAFSFKNLFIVQINSSSFSLNIISLTLSIIIAAYYLFYLIRLLIGSAKEKMPTQQKHKSPLRILFHFYRKNATKKLNIMFLPLLMFRNMGIAILIVMLAYNPLLQSATCLCLTIFFMLLNFCICPYPGIIRAYSHLSDFFFALQLGLLTYMTWLPEQSRIGTSKVLIILNFVQLGLAIGIALWIAITLTNKNICQKNKVKKSNKVAVQVQALKDLSKTILHEESMSNLNALKQQQKNRGIFFDMQNFDDDITKRVQNSPIQPHQEYIHKNSTQKSPEIGSSQTQNRTQKLIKKYRVKHKH